tara:strand:- start:244 stop:348 length:105 start_codon:yes stop_codon:yes gene_type:complete
MIAYVWTFLAIIFLGVISEVILEMIRNYEGDEEE